MAFNVNPQDYEDKGGGSRRPDVRNGDKVLWLAGMAFGTSRGGSPKIDCCFVCVHDPDESPEANDVGGLVWETFTLSQAAAWKLQQVSQALGQKASWDAENYEEAWNVLSARPVLAAIRNEPKRSGEGMRPEVQRFKVFGEDASKAMEDAVNDGEQFYRNWQDKKGGGGSSNAPPPF